MKMTFKCISFCYFYLFFLFSLSKADAQVSVLSKEISNQRKKRKILQPFKFLKLKSKKIEKKIAIIALLNFIKRKRSFKY